MHKLHAAGSRAPRGCPPSPRCWGEAPQFVVRVPGRTQPWAQPSQATARVTVPGRAAQKLPSWTKPPPPAAKPLPLPLARDEEVEVDWAVRSGRSLLARQGSSRGSPLRGATFVARESRERRKCKSEWNA